MTEPNAEPKNSQALGPHEFHDTLVLTARRRAFDYPTIANLDALIAAVRAEPPAEPQTPAFPVTGNSELDVVPARLDAIEARLKQEAQLLTPASVPPLDGISELESLRVENARLIAENIERGNVILELQAAHTFIRGADIPNTIEAARLVLVQRCGQAEAENARLAAELDNLRANEGHCLRWLSKALTGGNAETWDELFYAVDGMVQQHDLFMAGEARAAALQHGIEQFVEELSSKEPTERT